MLVVFQVAVGSKSDRRVNLTFGRGFMHAEATPENVNGVGVSRSLSLCLHSVFLPVSLSILFPVGLRNQ